MSQTLKIKNFGSLNVVKQSPLTVDIAAGASSLPIQNTVDFGAGPVLVGQPGGNSTELVTAASPSAASSLPLTGVTLQPHNENDPVYMLFGSQIQIYSAEDIYANGVQPPDANFSLLATVAIDGSQVTTLYNDTANVPGEWYKFLYYNPSSGATTQLSDSVAVQSGVVHYVSVDQIRRAAGFTTSPNVTNDIIAEFRDSAEKELNGALLPVYDFPLPVPTNPIVVQIVKNIAAGELKHEMYQSVNPAMAKDGGDMANKARNGGGEHTSLDDLVTRTVVLEDANFIELTVEEGHGVGGWPDETTSTTPLSEGGDYGPQFKIHEEY
jgi:hypothetical protein